MADAFAACALVLAGGESRRMGRPKAWLPWGEDEVLLQCVVRQLSPHFGAIAVAAAPSQRLPVLPEEVVVLRDSTPACGPLLALAEGLSHWQDAGCEGTCYVTTTDAPFFEAAIVSSLAEVAPEHAVVATSSGRGHHPLPGFYRVELGPPLSADVRNGERRLMHAVRRYATHWATAERLAERFGGAAVKRFQCNLNTEADYERARLREWA